MALFRTFHDMRLREEVAIAEIAIRHILSIPLGLSRVLGSAIHNLPQVRTNARHTTVMPSTQSGRAQSAIV